MLLAVRGGVLSRIAGPNKLCGPNVGYLSFDPSARLPALSHASPRKYACAKALGIGFEFDVRWLNLSLVLNGFGTLCGFRTRCGLRLGFRGGQGSGK